MTQYVNGIASGKTPEELDANTKAAMEQTAAFQFEKLNMAVEDFKATMKKHPIISMAWILYIFLILRLL